MRQFPEGEHKINQQLNIKEKVLDLKETVVIGWSSISQLMRLSPSDLIFPFLLNQMCPTM
jgi:hypothetical protein